MFFYYIIAVLTILVAAEVEIQKRCPQAAWMPPIRYRDDLGVVLKNMRATKGVELGVEDGFFFESVMQKWQSAALYVLVDIWAQPSTNYVHSLDLNDKEQLKKLESTKAIGEKMKSEGFLKEYSICRNFTSECVKTFPDHFFDFIYVDARHDYKAVRMDIEMWWPKLKEGGLMAGHDYVTQLDVAGKLRWDRNYDGTIDPLGRAVRGAVDEFFSDSSHRMGGCPVQVTVSYNEPKWNTWAVRKPFYSSKDDGSIFANSSTISGTYIPFLPYSLCHELFCEPSRLYIRCQHLLNGDEKIEETT